MVSGKAADFLYGLQHLVGQRITMQTDDGGEFGSHFEEASGEACGLTRFPPDAIIHA